MERIAIVGNSGSGKTSLARRIAAHSGYRHVELDAIHHQPGWTPLAPDVFRNRVTEAVCGSGWVVDGNYSVVRDIVWRAADTLVWVDPPRRTVMARIIIRTLRRGIMRTELWNGNRERVTNLFRTEPEENIVMWAWTRHAVVRDRYQREFASGAWAPRRLVRLRDDADVDRFVAEFTRS